MQVKQGMNKMKLGIRREEHIPFMLLSLGVIIYVLMMLLPLNAHAFVQQVKSITGLTQQAPTTKHIHSRKINKSCKACTDSFAAGTPVLTPNGLREIQTLNTGEQVLSRDEATGIIDYRPIALAYAHEHDDGLTITFEDGRQTRETITTTAEHPFYVVGQGFVSASELQQGMSILNAADEAVTITDIDPSPRQLTAYNFATL